MLFVPFPPARKLEHQELPAAMDIVCLSFPGEVGQFISSFLPSSYHTAVCLALSNSLPLVEPFYREARSSLRVPEFGHTWKLLRRVKTNWG